MTIRRRGTGPTTSAVVDSGDALLDDSVSLDAASDQATYRRFVDNGTTDFETVREIKELLMSP